MTLSFLNYKWRYNMLVQMIELQGVTMIQVGDEV